MLQDNRSHGQWAEQEGSKQTVTFIEASDGTKLQ